MRFVSILPLFSLFACTPHQQPDGDANGTGDDLVMEPVSGVGDDLDGDGYRESVDCDDDDVNVNPGEDEVLNGVDDDCDDLVDCDDSEDVVLTASVYDGDGDGYGDDTNGDGEVDVAYICADGDANAALISEQTGGDPSLLANYIEVEYGEFPDYALPEADCDDSDSTSYPGGTEVCDGADNDCNGTEDDDAVDESTWYADADHDTYGDPAVSTTSCDAGEHWVADWSDCDDNNAGINPAAEELCDEVDNNCDGTVDGDATDAGTFYADTDTDGYGDPDSSTTSCGAAEGWVEDASDCDDGDILVNPAATEVCDGVDNDCNDDVDNDATDMALWFQDRDADLYGDGGVSYTSCEQPLGYVSTSGDCNDAADTINPAAAEIMDGVDNDCNGDIDEVTSGCVIDIELFSGRSGPALTVIGSVSGDTSFTGNWIDGSVSTVAYTDTPLGGSDHQYSFELNHCLGTGETILFDASFSDGTSVCNSDSSLEAGTVYAYEDSTELSVYPYDNGDGTCQLQIQ